MEAPTPGNRTGVWLIGALGDISATLISGARAMAHGMASGAGLVAAQPPLDQLDLCAAAELVFGGIDIVSGSVSDNAAGLVSGARTLSAAQLESILPDLHGIEADVVSDAKFGWRPGHRAPGAPPLRELVGAHREYLRRFAERHELEQIVVVNLTSAEPLPRNDAAHEQLPALERALDEDRADIVTPSMVSAYAAFMEDRPYLNFTPNLAIRPRSLQALAARRGLLYYGDDGKTGETLLKTVLAPMFAARNLRILSWEGTNMLGNNDGLTLEDPDNRAAKMSNKEGVLEKMLGYAPHADVSISYVPSLGDWKTAWDLIHFRGFLDVAMSMQFTWQGCDSILAAPLVLDMVRLTALAERAGESGPMTQLACFFKNPIGVDEMAFAPQYDMLLAWAARHLPARGTVAPLRRRTT